VKNKILELLGVDKLIDTIQKIIEVRISMIKEEVEEKVSSTLATILPLVLILLSVSSLILFCSFTLAFYLSEVFNSLATGFGLVSIVYLVISIIFFLLRDNKNMREKFKAEIKKRS
jgi:uncharacterized membrane protein